MDPSCLRSCAAAALVGTLTLSGCSDDPVVPLEGPAEIQATLDSPNGPEGAAVIELDQLGLEPITVLGGDAFSQELGSVTHVVIVLTEPGQIAFLMTVNDAGRLPSARVLEVADGANELRTTLSGYRVELNVIIADDEDGNPR